MSESEIINQCSSETFKGKKITEYGYENTYEVNGKKVVLTFNQYSNGEDDYDDELIHVEIEK